MAAAEPSAAAAGSSHIAANFDSGDAFFSATDKKQSLLGSKKVKGVDQPLRAIVVTNKFLPEEARRFEDMQESESEDEEKGEPAEEDLDSDEDDDDEEVAEAEEELGWDDLMGASSSAKAKGKGRAVEEEDDEDEDEEEDPDTSSEPLLQPTFPPMFPWLMTTSCFTSPLRQVAQATSFFCCCGRR